jgi:hypothetical protein
MRYLRTASIGVLAGMTAGIVWGIGARLAMRLIALADGQTPDFSLGGTLLILMVGAFFGMPFGLILIGSRRLIRMPGWRRGLMFGLIILLIFAYPFYLGPLQSEGSDQVLVIAVALFGSLFLLFGLTLEATAARLERLMVRAPPRLATTLGIVTIAVAASFEVYILLAMMANSS